MKNKREEFIRGKKVVDDEGIRLKRLAIMDPEKIDETKKKNAIESEMDLYHFQHKSGVRRRQPSPSNMLRMSPSKTAKSNLDKKIFKMTMQNPS